MDEHARRIPFSLETFLKRSWPALAVGAVLILVIIAILMANIFKRTSSNNAPIANAGTSTTPAIVTSSTLGVAPRLLDGVSVSSTESALQPFAVMVENAVEARPLMGPAKANIVLEAPVEGGITRFMLVFDATSTADQIGPVRSARPYYVDWADGLGAVYAHVGGSPQALQNISALSHFRNLDEFFNAGRFWRTSKREAPHNTYTRIDLLREAAVLKHWMPSTFDAWHYLSHETSSTERGQVAKITIPYGGAYTVDWQYDPKTNIYRRYQAGVQQKDADGEEVDAKNVVVVLTDGQVLDDKGRLRIRTTGSGRAEVFRDGMRIDVRWHRTAHGWIQFEGVDGGDVVFEPGTTWISVVTSQNMMP